MVVKLTCNSLTPFALEGRRLKLVLTEDGSEDEGGKIVTFYPALIAHTF